MESQLQFRVLIIGRANAGKTSILQRVCETTESPIVYGGYYGVNRMEVKLDPSIDRGEHTIDDEFVFSNHTGYVFHDSRGIESGSTEELEILQKFIRRRCRERRLHDRLHAIWYCVPMDNHRPQLDLKFYKDICPDQNVPVIVVFTKHDQFLRNVAINMSDYPNEYPDRNVSEVAEKLFQEHYLHPLGDDIIFVQLKNMHMQNSHCDDLIEKTAAALNGGITALMLLAVQRYNLQLSVKVTLNRVGHLTGSDVEHIVRESLFQFPYIWYFGRFDGVFGIEDVGELEYGFLVDDDLLLGDDFLRIRLADITTQIISLPSIQILTTNSLGHHHLIIAVIIILKHATFLRLSKLSSESAILHADQHYCRANIDLKIQEYLTTTSQEQSAMLFVDFIIMATTELESMHPDILL